MPGIARKDSHTVEKATTWTWVASGRRREILGFGFRSKEIAGLGQTGGNGGRLARRIPEFFYADNSSCSGSDSFGRRGGVAVGQRLVEVPGTACHHVPGNQASGGCGSGRHARGHDGVRTR